MSSCPENPKIINCGLEAANYLVSNAAIIIDPFDEGGAPIRLAHSSFAVEEVLGEGELVLDERGDVARFKCLECLEKIDIISHLSDLTVKKPI